MASRLLHHVEIGVKNGLETVLKFIISYKFRIVACRENDLTKQWLLSAGSTRFLVTEAKKVWPARAPSEILESEHAEKTVFGNDNVTSSMPSPAGHKSQRKNITTAVNRSILCDKFAENDHDYVICDWKMNTTTSMKNGIGNEKVGSKEPLHTVTRPDSVFNVALEVDDVNDCVDRLSDIGGKILRMPRTVGDKSGHVTYATIKSCIGNVVHTLINSSKYEGLFLPGFRPVTSEHEIWPFAGKIEKCDARKQHETSGLFNGIDHVAFAVNRGTSRDIQNWYKNVFGMERFRTNRNEDESEGLVLKGKNIGLRLSAMNYSRGTFQDHTQGLKFVLAESLPQQGPNQVDTFLREHGGPGVQHIGLYASNIIQTVQSMKDGGASFMDTPPTYYSKVGKLEEIKDSGEDLTALQELGILLDKEADGQQEGASTNRYLMQVFTKPLFDCDTFFLEIIQRCGATGFGAGNISALWRSVEAFLQAKKKVDSKDSQFATRESN